MNTVNHETKAQASNQNFRNIKYKRKRNLIKKSCQFAEISGMDVIIFFYKRKNHNLEEYYTTKDF